MWRLILTAVVFALLAVIAGVLLGWRVTRPTEALTDAAVRLGQGDFATSIPTGGPGRNRPARAHHGRHAPQSRRRSTAELRQREAEAQVVLEAVVEGVYAVDQERNIRYLNPQAARLLGIEAEEAIGQFCGDVLKPCGPPGSPNGTRPCATTACPILRARQAGSAQSVEQLQTRSGNRQTVITSSRVVDGLQVQVMRDETELEGVRRARDTVLANISHEFRTPLAAQLASIELLRDGLEDEPAGETRRAGAVARARHAAAHAAHRQPAGERAHRVRAARRAPPEHRARATWSTMRAALVDALLRQRRQPLEVDVPEDLALQGDATRLTQVFVNLIANASKFAPEGTPIRVGAQSRGRAVSAPGSRMRVPACPRVTR